MKLQNLGVIFIIIILPISILLNAYTRNHIKTLSLQTSYDTKLNNATYDALKAFQLNTVNSDTSDLANSKLRDIEASANTFFNSVASNFNMAGYNQDILKEYVPALVYTMYDGYYIYSPYTNTLDTTNKDSTQEADSVILDNSDDNQATYKHGQKISGIKPYIYYSCRYVQNNGNDFIITYSLDNYITIQGQINNKWVFDYGYLLDNITNTDGIKYRGVTIDLNDQVEEYVYDPDEEDASKALKKLPCIKLNGVKYYKDDSNEWFSILNGKKYKQDSFTANTTAAIQYYKDAYNFKQKILNKNWTDIDRNRHNDGYGIGELKTSNAKDDTIQAENDTDRERKIKEKFGDYKIFDFGDYNTGKSIENPNSNFNQHRLAVIRYSIEKNLSIAIANYNHYSSTTSANFLMPALKENEWEEIINNVSIISFLQGLNIGGKIYNGYSIVTNNKNQEVVKEDSIYILTGDNQYHRPNDKDLVNSTNIKGGVLNIDLERKSNTASDGQPIYFIPRGDRLTYPVTGCYESIVTQTKVEPTDNLYQYMEDKRTLATAYYTALGRERYGMYKTNNNPDTIKEIFGVTE